MEYLSLFRYFSKDFYTFYHIFLVILKSYGIFKSISILFKGFLYFLPQLFLVILKSYGILKSISKIFKGFLYSYHIFKYILTDFKNATLG